MRNSIANFVKNLQISKDFAGNRVNGLGNVPRCGGEQTKTVPLVYLASGNQKNRPFGLHK